MRPDLSSVGHAKQIQYRPAVDGLRGVAVLAVLAFHAFPGVVPGGYVGVDVFFVISGFLITSVIARQMTLGNVSFADFYWRRVRRLFPALVLVLATTLALGWLLLLPDEFKQLGKHASAAAAFLANFALWRESGYFDTAAEFKPFLHLWSLGIEEQFYLVWPALLAAFWKRRTALLIILSTLVIASFTLSVNLATSAPVANFYSPASRFWELGVGCLLALSMEGRTHAAQPSADRRLAVLWSTCPLAGLALILASLLVLDSTTAFPGWAALLPVIGSLLILATPDDAPMQRRLLGSRPLIWTGLISYALYLWHWPLLSFLNILDGGPPPLALRCAALGASFVLAWMTYRYVEIPIRRLRALKFNLALAGSAAAAGIAGLVIYAAAGVPQRFDADIQALHHGPRRDEVCHSRFEATVPINYCRTTSHNPPSIVFVGDSRAHAIYEVAASMLPPEQSVMLLGRGGCPPLLNVRIRGYDPNEKECQRVWRTFVRYVQQTKPKVVVVVGNGSFLVNNPKIRLIPKSTPAGGRVTVSKEAILEYGVRSLLRELTVFSRVIYLGEMPIFSTAPSCFLRTITLPTVQCHPERDRGQVEQAMAPYNRVLNRIQATFPNVQLVDAVAVLCAENVCSQRPPGKPILYSDAVHLSPAGARLLVEHTDLPRLITRGIALADSG